MKPRTSPWLGVLLLAAPALTALDCLLLQRKFAAFTGGFLHPAHLAGLEIPLFLLGSLWLDAAAAAVLLLPALYVTRRLDGARRLLLASALCAVPIALATFGRFDVSGYVGDWIEFHWGIHAGRETMGLLAIGAVGLGLFLVAWWLSRFLPGGSLAFLCSRSPRRAVACSAVLVFGAPVLMGVGGLCMEGVERQLVRKSSGRWAARAGRRATDFDSDGFGLTRRPCDSAPFDARIHPFAVDQPGNGIDENGVGGDLAAPGDFSFEHHAPVKFTRRPDLILFVLETYRADNLHAELDGRPVTPVLNGLVAAGAVTGPAYTHNGSTVESLTHLFTGSLSCAVRDGVLHDFAANGYLTACISGQDESFGNIEQATGMVRADHFVDARDDSRERTSAFASPGSLTVPWKVVVANVERFLEERGTERRPIFLYVNFQDCHYPYHHRALENLFEQTPVPRGEIVPSNARNVRRTYLNTAANVDKAVGRVLEAWDPVRGRRPAFVIVGDHGESLFEHGTLGHGVGIGREQTEIVFLMGGLPVDCNFPVGLAEVRGILRGALSRPEAAARRTVDPGKWVFQYVGSVDRPRLLGAAFAGGGIVHELRRGATWRWGDPPPGSARSLTALWEQIVLHRAGAPVRH